MPREWLVRARWGLSGVVLGAFVLHECNTRILPNTVRVNAGDADRLE